LANALIASALVAVGGAGGGLFGLLKGFHEAVFVCDFCCVTGDDCGTGAGGGGGWGFHEDVATGECRAGAGTAGCG